MTIDIRTFRESDTDAVISVWEACELTRSWNDPVKDINRKQIHNDGLFLVAEQNAQLIGSVMAGYEGHRGWINYLAVLPEYRKQGIGRALMLEAEARLLARGCPKINLQIRTGNTGVIAFYESIGYLDDKATSLGKRLIPDE